MQSIYFAFRPAEISWGGANNFLRALHKTILEQDEFNVIDAPQQDCDLIFMNELGTGRGNFPEGRMYTLGEVKKMRGRNTRLIVRAINLRRSSIGYTIRNFKDNKILDMRILSLLHMADHVIFQSHWQKDMFSQYGFRGKSWSIVHNGAAGIFTPAQTPIPLDKSLRFLSSVGSKRVSKNHALISELSKINGVEVHYAGNWPENMDPANIHQHGVISSTELADLWKTIHYCFHPAVVDPCPNAVCEALASGVPVVYNPKPGGTVELASPTGIALNEGNLEATVHEAFSCYETLAEKTSAVSEYYSINRACSEYIEIFKRYSS